MRLKQVTLRKDSPIIGKSLAESGLRRNYGVMLVGLEQGQENLTIVSIDHVFYAGDVLWVVGERETLKHLSI